MLVVGFFVPILAPDLVVVGFLFYGAYAVIVVQNLCHKREDP